jgi:membrane-bound inhibitor of C-type lysozyme
MKSARLLTIAALVGPAALAQTAPRELELRCTELPGTEVSVDRLGQVVSHESVAREFQPIDVRVMNTQYLSGGSVVPARIESNVTYLETDLATWTAGESVTSDRGGLHIDLRNDMLFLSVPFSGNEALFRRFECVQERTPGKTVNPVRYDCGDDYGLEVTLEIAEFGDGEAFVRYPGGEVRLPHVPSGSGAKYSSRDSELWIKGNEAMFTLFDGAIKHCRVVE